VYQRDFIVEGLKMATDQRTRTAIVSGCHPMVAKCDGELHAAAALDGQDFAGDPTGVLRSEGTSLSEHLDRRNWLRNVRGDGGLSLINWR
jgi:hypothetical protein